MIQTDRHRIVGDLVLPRDGHRSRLSDFLNAGGSGFISLTRVEIDSGARKPERLEFAVVAVGHIRIAHPLDGGAGG